MQDISPLHCLRQCGRKYRYATLQEGNICLCANSLPVTAVDDSECGMTCPGSSSWPSEAQASLRCGGRLRKQRLFCIREDTGSESPQQRSFTCS
ncbi:hypothetical protein OS493_009325 [Desmophyllum pertusum]|uniref:WSC domain-containing protein n=1 Tax=Desmophyllum pertusum TaxID=174260 RepID=A0A9W9Z2M1_9CNID|nr:hypothetical protein OS493_009325 [Desmophyllum pertusum]